MGYILNADHVSVTANHKEILHDCSLTLSEGEFVGIIGPNGAGKSTLLKAVRGIEERSGGRVDLFGENIESLSEKEVARRLAFMQQDTHVEFGFTAREVVMAARYPYLKWWQRERPTDEEIVHRSMTFTGVLPLADKLIQEVSGGERQRILLAKILAQETPLIFLDEPTASLDLVYQEEIFRYCADLTKNQRKTVVMVCHDLSMSARYCSRLVLIAKGCIAADGRPEEVLTAEHLRNFFGLSSVVYTNAVSGYLDLYTYQERKTVPSERNVLVLGKGRSCCSVYRQLYISGYRVSAGLLSEDSLAAEAARNFHIPWLSQGQEKELKEWIRAHQIIILCGPLSSEEKRLYGVLSQEKKKIGAIYSLRIDGMDTSLSWEQLSARITEQALLPNEKERRN